MDVSKLLTAWTAADAGLAIVKASDWYLGHGAVGFVRPPTGETCLLEVGTA